jgi:membrane protease YdiL (CAAX protease family)/CRP-like cAMP-binding protein
MKEQDKRLIEQMPLFGGLDSTAVEKIIACGSIIEIEADAYLCHENQSADYFYIVLSGALAVIKKHESSQRDHQIGAILAGKSVGEMALLGQKLRSASVKALEPARLFRAHINDIRQLIYYNTETRYPYLPLIRELEGILAERLQHMNGEKITAIETELEFTKEKCSISAFIIYTITTLSLFSFLTQWLTSLIKDTSNSTYITLPIMILLTIAISIGARKVGFSSLQEMGISGRQWRRSAYEAVIFTIPILIALTLLKYLAVTYISSLAHFPVIDIIHKNSLKPGYETREVQQIIILNLCYLFIVVPTQEFITRGVLQNSLERFLVNKHRFSPAIVISNLIFSSFHIFLSLPVALLTFLPGLYFGWLYSRYKTLVAPCIAHGLIGIWGLSIINLPALFR